MIYCYANGIFSSRRIERATHRDIGVRFVAANRHPDHDTIARFRRENFAAVSESFLQVLLLAKELKLLRVGLVSVDASAVPPTSFAGRPSSRFFGVIKAVLGFAGFSLRGLEKVEGEWTLVALAYNCKRLHKLSLAV